MPGEERMLKAEDLCNTARIHTELFGLLTSCQAGLGHKGLREWAREDGGEEREKIWDILIRESREQAGDLETLNSSCLLKSRTFFFYFLFCSTATHSVIFPFSDVFFFLLQFV